MLRIFFCCLLLIPFSVNAQKKNKTGKLSFCGWQIRDKNKISLYYQSQFDFLNVQQGDTIVDIGAASGAYEGVFLSVNEAKNVSFVLVDINADCLNAQKLANMLAYYSAVKGDSIGNRFQLIRNTPDSLWLPLNRYKKVWLLNTLHEIPDQEKMVRDIGAVLQPGGEIVVFEKPPTKQGQLHGGCRKPLLSFDRINELFTANGFSYSGRKDILRKGKIDIIMARFVKR